MYSDVTRIQTYYFISKEFTNRNIQKNVTGYVALTSEILFLYISTDTANTHSFIKISKCARKWQKLI